MRNEGCQNGPPASLLEPDILLPVQYLAGRFSEPERCLLLAVLENAVSSYRKHALAQDPRDQRCFREAEEWFVSDDDSWPFAFESICDALDIDADHLRTGLDRWRRVFAATAPARETANETEPLTAARSV